MSVSTPASSHQPIRLFIARRGSVAWGGVNEYILMACMTLAELPPRPSSLHIRKLRREQLRRKPAGSMQTNPSDPAQAGKTKT